MIARISIALSVLTITGLSISAQNNTYTNKDIPSELTSGADAVVRESTHTIELIDKDHSKSTVHEVITVMNADGVNRAYFAHKMDELNKARFIDGAVYDKDGKLVKKLTSADIQTMNLKASYTTAAGTKVLAYKPSGFQYPYTVEYNYEIEKTGFLTLLKWDPVRFGGTAVEEATLELKNNSGIPVKGRQNLDGTWTNEAWTNGAKTWTMKNQKARFVGGKKLPEKMVRKVTLVSKEFEIDGRDGSYESWGSFGEWIDGLNAGRQELPAEFQNQINEMTAGMSDLDKVRTLYEYMQNYTTFINVSKGTASWLPISAAEVHRTRKGDCKALTNYMKSLLDVVGVESHYSLVRAGKNAMDIPKDFPINNFNHVILVVNVDGQDIWLENTNPENPFGYLSSFTNNRWALKIDGKNSKLVRTKSIDKYVASGDRNSQTPEESVTGG